MYRKDNVYHTVGAALRCKNGKIYTGVNCDGIHGSCAEFTAMGAAITAGEREFDCIVAVTGRGKRRPDSAALRQLPADALRVLPGRQRDRAGRGGRGQAGYPRPAAVSVS